MPPVDPYELGEDDDASSDEALSEEVVRDRDGVGSLHDTEAEAGDEEEVGDDFDLDEREARELGVQLDRGDDSETTLD
jgi:hypothetical protein